MLRSIIFVWILMCVFVGSKEASQFFRTAIGALAVLWSIKMIVSFGFGLLPVIILIAFVTKVVMPFVKGFISSFAAREE